MIPAGRRRHGRRRRGPGETAWELLGQGLGWVLGRMGKPQYHPW